MTDPIFRIVPRTVWDTASDPWHGMPYDQADGYVHSSTAAQVPGTLAAHFAGQTGLVLLTINPDALPANSLHWELSRGGMSFPHIYGGLPHAAVTAVEPITAPHAPPPTE